VGVAYCNPERSSSFAQQSKPEASLCLLRSKAEGPEFGGAQLSIAKQSTLLFKKAM